MSKITDNVTALARPLAQELGMELWDVEYVREAGQQVLRVFLDKEGGVSLDDCESFSRALDPVLDEADPIPVSYVFEVSSAGAERELKRPEDFARFMGHLAELRHYQNVDGARSHIGKLAAYDAGAVTIDTPQGPRRFEKAQIAQVRLRLE